MRRRSCVRGEAFKARSISGIVRKTHTTPAALRDYFLENPAAFNTILHNARPDAIEIQDIIGFLYVLDNRVVEHFADGMDTGSEDGRG